MPRPVRACKMITLEPTPQEILLPVPPEFREGLDPRSWLNVSKGLLGWALCTLRLAVREANAFFQMYKHAREENKKLRSILAEHNIEAPPYDWNHDEELIIESHAAIPMGLWDDPDVEDLGPLTLSVHSPKQLVQAGKQMRELEGFLEDIRDEFYSNEISKGGWRVKQWAKAW